MARHGLRVFCGVRGAGYFKTIDRWAGRPTDEDRDGDDDGGDGDKPAGGDTDDAGPTGTKPHDSDAVPAERVNPMAARDPRFSSVAVTSGKAAAPGVSAASADVAVSPEHSLPVRRGRRYRFTLCGECVPAGEEGIPCCKPLNWAAWRAWNIHRKT